MRNTIIRRLAVPVGLITASLLLSAHPAAAADLSDYLAKADAAAFSGRQIVVTVYDGVSRAGVFDVEQAGDLMMIEQDGNEALVGSGRVESVASGEGISIPSWSQVSLAGRYSMVEGGDAVQLGRKATVIDIIENGLVRARIVFDRATSAPLTSLVYDGDGDLFRYSAMIEFTPAMSKLNGVGSSDSAEFDVMVPADPGVMPATADGYQRTDTYEGPDGTLHAFYSDGLFSFSLFQVAGDVRSDRFEVDTTIDVNGATYRRATTPTEVWITWQVGSTGYVLVGDLPPDHLDRVLAELPQPAERSFLRRLWHGLFGR